MKGPILEDDPPTIAQLRAVLATAGYTVQALQDLLGRTQLHWRPADVAIHERRLPQGSQLATLVRLFLLNLDTGIDHAARALAPLRIEQLHALGIAAIEADSIRSRVQLVPCEDLVLACDRGRGEEDADVGAAHVTGVNPPAVHLAKMTVRRSVRDTLDVGTGGGIQALLAARHSERVVGTDVNPRALNFAAFNARLNGIDNVEWRLGSLFEPVRGEEFDLIVANPPYVISPETQYLYRDSGRPGDSICRQWVTEAPGHLREGGFAQALISWIPVADDWAQPLRAWVANRGVDAWLLHYSTEDPLSHASKWNQPQYECDVQAFTQALDRWLDYYRSSGIEQISFGAVAMRRRSGRPNWLRADEVVVPEVTAAGDHIARVFDAHERLADVPHDSDLLGIRCVLTADHRLEQTLIHRDGAWQPDSSMLCISRGLGFRGPLGSETLRLLGFLDGERTLGVALAENARAMQMPPDDAAAYTVAALPLVRRLIELGFLELR